VEERVEERVDESAEEVLARLERYAGSLRGRPQAVDTLIPSRDEAPPRRRRFASEVAPGLMTVAICSFVILFSERFHPEVAVVMGAVLMLVGVVGIARRVPLAKAYTFGLVIAALLIRFS
jgi:hypothetical protein